MANKKGNMYKTRSKRIELHCHSGYSKMDGVSSVEDLIETATDIGIAGLALTDHASVAGFGDAVDCSRDYPEFKMIYGMEGYVVDDLNQENSGDVEFIKTAPVYHVSFLIRNAIGKKNLFKLITMSNLEYEEEQPRIPWSEIQKHRDGLLIGSACSEGQLYCQLAKGVSKEELEKIAQRFDYLEIQPIDTRLYLADTNNHNEAVSYYIQELDRRIVELGERLGIPVVATGNVHFATSEETQVRAVLQNYIGYEHDNQLELQLRDTDEMLEAFSYLGEEKAWEIVVENTHRIADKIEDFMVLPRKEGEYYPKLDDAYERLNTVCLDKLHELYGEDIEQSVLDRLKWELNGLRKSGSDSIMLLTKELVEKSGLSPYEVGYRGSLGSMLSAYLCGITCVNPLESQLPLYPEFAIGINGDKPLDLVLNFPADSRDKVQKICLDLEGIGAAFQAGTILSMSDQLAYEAIYEYEIKHEVNFAEDDKEWLIHHLYNVVRGNGENPSGIMLVPEEFEISDFSPLVKMGDDEVSSINYRKLRGLYKNNICSIEGMVYMLIKKTGINVKDISLKDADVAAMFHGRTILHTGLKDGIDALGVQNFRDQFMSTLGQKLKINSFTDVVRADALSHGTGTWNNAKELLNADDFSKDNIISTREDIYEYMTELGFDREEAFSIAEFVYKGCVGDEDERKDCVEKWEYWKQKILDAGAPEWFVWSCEQIEYMFPRAHCYRYALEAWWGAWFKLYYPKEFYEVYFEVYGRTGLVEAVKQGPDAFALYKQGYYDGMEDIKDNFDVDEEDIKNNFDVDEEIPSSVHTAFVLAEEMFARGITLGD